MEEYGETHSELKHAMEFVLQVLELEHAAAAADSSWELKYEVRTSLGLDVQPESKFLGFWTRVLRRRNAT
jgi:hypothetical protein